VTTKTLWLDEEDGLSTLVVEHVTIVCYYSKECCGWCCSITFGDVIEHDLGHPRDTLDDCKRDAVEFTVSLLEQDRDQIATAISALEKEQGLGEFPDF